MIDSVRSNSFAVLQDRLLAIQAELDQQRRFRAEQPDELAVDAVEALATADQSRLGSPTSSQWPRNRPWARLTPPSGGWRTAPTEPVSAAAIRSHGNGWRSCR